MTLENDGASGSPTSSSSQAQPHANMPARPRTSQQPVTSPTPGQGRTADTPTGPLFSPEAASNGNGHSQPTMPPELPPVSVRVVQAQMPSRRTRRMSIPILVTLFVLCLLLAFGAIFAPHFFAGTETQLTPTSPTTGHTGPFVQPSLNATQINALHNLVSHMQYKQLASLYVERMSLDEEIGQLIMVEYGDTSYSPDLDYMINNLHAGGVIMYEFQMLSFNQTKHDIAQMQHRAKIPLLISADEEGGPYVHRLLHIYPPRMSATQIYETGNPNVATQQGKLAAQQLSALGINVNLAPDVDVQLVPGYDLVTRTFGYTPQSVITYAGAYMKGLQGSGVIACIKHYPGLGDATGDAHQLLPVINRSKAQIYATELAPYRAFIQSPNKLLNPGMIMPTDLLMPAIDPVMPAELSPIFMTDILRKQLGYDGVALTDALYMKGISQKWSMPEAAVLALKAGNDMLLGPTGADQTLAMINGIKAALKDGTLSKARIDEAATRIIALKMQYHLMPAIPPQ